MSEAGDSPNTNNTALEYEYNDLVFGKLFGFPWWPARVRRLLAEKESVAVRFCGTRDFGVVGHAPDGVRPFDDHPGWCDAPPERSEPIHGQLMPTARAARRHHR